MFDPLGAQCSIHSALSAILDTLNSMLDSQPIAFKIKLYSLLIVSKDKALLSPASNKFVTSTSTGCIHKNMSRSGVTLRH